MDICKKRKKKKLFKKNVIFDQKFQNLETLGDKFVIFDQQLKKTWGLWVTSIILRGLLVRSELRRGS